MSRMAVMPSPEQHRRRSEDQKRASVAEAFPPDARALSHPNQVRTGRSLRRRILLRPRTIEQSVLVVRHLAQEAADVSSPIFLLEREHPVEHLVSIPAWKQFGVGIAAFPKTGREAHDAHECLCEAIAVQAGRTHEKCPLLPMRPQGLHTQRIEEINVAYRPVERMSDGKDCVD